MGHRNSASEMNFDGIVAPSYNHATTAPGGPGNLASAANRGRPSNPRAAALEGLTKVKELMDIGVRQALLPPLVRPNLRALYRLGLIKDAGLLHADDTDALARHLARYSTAAPHLLAASFSGAAVWTANWATISPSADTADPRRLHITPANQSRSFHRSLESEETLPIFRQIFNDPEHFEVHDPLPSSYAVGDEGAANHLRLVPRHGEKAVNIFVYGRDGFAEPDSNRRHLARQTLEASRAISRLHELDPFFTIFLRQNPNAIDAGIFHNDVIATANLDLLFYHEFAFVDPARAISDVCEAYRVLTNGKSLRLIMVPNDEVSLEDAAVSYLFNSQIVNDRDGRTILIAPAQCQFVPSVNRFLQTLQNQQGPPFDEIKFVHVPSSMRSGGGPACLRLRIILTNKQEKAISGRVFLTTELWQELVSLVTAEYPTEVSEWMFTDETFLKTCFNTTRRIYEILGLAPIGTSPNS